jgi:hypothetical protein
MAEQLARRRAVGVHQNERPLDLRCVEQGLEMPSAEPKKSRAIASFGQAMILFSELTSRVREFSLRLQWNFESAETDLKCCIVIVPCWLHQSQSWLLADN